MTAVSTGPHQEENLFQSRCTLVQQASDRDGNCGGVFKALPKLRPFPPHGSFVTPRATGERETTTGGAGKMTDSLKSILIGPGRDSKPRPRSDKRTRLSSPYTLPFLTATPSPPPFLQRSPVAQRCAEVWLRWSVRMAQAQVQRTQ